MGKINWARVILGGLLAGVVINLSGILAHLVMGQQWQAAMEALGKEAEAGAGAYIAWLVYGFLLGIAAVWLYAAIRPRYGAGPKTAVVAGVGTWVLAYFFFTLGMANMGLFPTRLLTIGAIWGLLEIIVATVVGAWPYKEGEEPVAPSAAAAPPGGPAGPPLG